MRRLKPSLKAYLVIAFLAIAALGFITTVNKQVHAQTPSTDWPMAGANPERTSWTPETLPGNIKTLWVKPLVPHVPQHTQVIAAEGKVFISTTKGLYAFDAATGSDVWTYPTELPLGHSPTYNNSVLYVGGMDRKMHAVNAATGQGQWTFLAEGGFSTNPVVINGVVYAGNRDGAFYAINATDGTLVWKYQTGNQILQSAAYKDGVLYFASNDAYAYALNATDGGLVWKSTAKLPSMGQYVWWPVIYQDYVIFTRTPFEDGLNGAQSGAIFPGTNGNFVPGVLGTEPGNWPAGQATLNVATNPSGPMSIPNYFETYPHRRSTVFINRASGQEQQFDIDNDGITDAAPISTLGDAGTRYPPLVSGFDNVLYFRTVNRNQNASFSSATVSGWKVGTPILSLPYSNMTGQSAGMPSDEPSGISAGGNKIYWNHCCDRFVGATDISQPNTDFLSRLDDANRQWRYINSPGLPFYTPPTNIGMPINYYQEAIKFFFDPPYPAIFWNENNKVGPTIYQGRMYVILGNALVTLGDGGAGSNAPILPSAPEVLSQNGASNLTPTYLTSRLETEISKILTAGHLKPSFMFAGGISGLVKNKYDEYMLDYWHNPSDIQVTLLRALPYLSETLQQDVKTYLQNEFAAYSPIAYNHVGWTTSGTQRDPWDYPPTDAKIFTNSFGAIPYGNFSGWSTPPHNIYAVWKYAQAGLGDPVTLFAQVQNRLKPSIVQVKSNLTDSYLTGFPHINNAYIAGYTGYIELAKLADKPQSFYQPYQDELNRLLALRVSTLTADPVPPSPYGSDHGYYDTVITIWNFMYLTPELADYLQTNAQSNVESIIATYQTIAPNWMIAHNGETQGESAFVPYQQTHSLFQALAMIKNAPSEELAKYLDTPIVPVGDLYYIDNLISVLEATPSTSPSPPPSYKGDANTDGIVNDDDILIWRDNYGTTNSGGATVGDFNMDTQIDGIDYVIWYNTYGT